MKDKLKVPKLRFKEFSGEWEEKKLDDILQLTLRPIKKPSGGYKALGVRSHAKGTFHKEVENSEDVAIDVLYEVRKDDLIINITFAWEHAVAICTEADSGRLVSHRFPTYMAKSNLDIKFMSYLIKQEFFRYNLELISPGGAGRNRVMSKSKFLELSMITPSLPEQQKIADFLSKVDEKIEKLTKKKELLEQYKKGVMQKIFSQELGFKDDNGNDFPYWEEKEIFDIVNEYNEKTVENNQYPILSSSMNGIFLQSDYFLKQTASADTTGYKIVPKGYFTYRSMSDTGYFTFNIQNIVDKGIVSPAYPVFFVKEEILSDFLYFQLNNDKLLINEILSLKEGGTRYALGFNKFKNLHIFLPSLPEQQKIADFLSTLDKKIDIVSQELGQVQEFKKGLLQQMFV